MSQIFLYLETRQFKLTSKFPPYKTRIQKERQTGIVTIFSKEFSITIITVTSICEKKLLNSLFLYNSPNSMTELILKSMQK